MTIIIRKYDHDRITKHPDRQTVVVIGNGMVGHRFCERLVAVRCRQEYRIVTFCEEPRPAYDRVNLTKFFSYRDPEPLMLARQEWYQDHGITLYVGDKATAIDRDRRVVRSRAGTRDRLRPGGAGDRLGPVRAADSGRGQEGRLRLPDDRRPGADHRLCAAREAGGGRSVAACSGWKRRRRSTTCRWRRTSSSSPLA